MEFAGRTVLVTGGARGVGRELTRQLVDLGAHVVAVGRDSAALDAVAAEHGSRVSGYVVDLADPEATSAFVAEVVRSHPELSVVINNAGVQTPVAYLHDPTPTTLAAARQEIAVNLDAVITLSTGLLPHLSTHDSAAIVNITTGLALAPKASAPVYCATKAAVRTFTRALRYQCEADAPRVKVIDAVFPLVDTDMTRGRGSNKITPAEAAAAVLTSTRRGTPTAYIGKTGLLNAIMRVSPALGHRIMRAS
ncbi:putative oxidoreductase [Actinokineospora baliensis]|uniref:SDR family oxidoreductase n=1 Tax=Actinokineospora baliensis TaxID=547056 RepID=UPI00195612B1|nr:SDR family NAD(P)-dependent oxidoreductase [Actinokineospora baliensis]MBM7773177.1 putative oxidoreductase [Actinokineospora baliensis]